MNDDRRLIAGVLANLPMFCLVAPAELQAVALRCIAIGLQRDALIAATGTRLPGVYAVAYGSVKLALRNGGPAARLLRLVSARQTFGEAAALLGKPTPYEASALTESKVVVIPTAALLALIDRDPRFARALVTALAERKLEVYREMHSAMLLTGAQRLAAALDEIAGNDTVARLPFSKTVLAAKLGLKKETLSRLLRQFAADGLIRVERREIAILDRERLPAV
jgi:CRP-like cAMP-binding protein